MTYSEHVPTSGVVDDRRADPPQAEAIAAETNAEDAGGGCPPEDRHDSAEPSARGASGWCDVIEVGRVREGRCGQIGVLPPFAPSSARWNHYAVCRRFFDPACSIEIGPPPSWGCGALLGSTELLVRLRWYPLVLEPCCATSRGDLACATPIRALHRSALLQGGYFERRPCRVGGAMPMHAGAIDVLRKLAKLRVEARRIDCAAEFGGDVCVGTA